MIGFVLTTEQKEQAEAAFLAAQLNHVKSRMYDLGACWVYIGDHAGLWFVPFSDAALTRKIIRDKTFQDFPEFADMIESLGGLNARVNVNEQDLIDPDAP